MSASTGTLPLTDWRDGDEDPADLAAGVAGGEGFDWFYASDADRAAGVRPPIEDEAHGEHWAFRQKDLVGWWANAHHDRPGGLRSETPTAWMPGMKPVRLMEFGCAAVHRGANAPNRFRDAKSSEDGLPPFSDGSRDDLMQRRALEAMLGHFSDPANNPQAVAYDGRMLEAMDAWCWDARPYPDFPGRSEVWADAANWNTGHWLNGRLAGEARDLIAAILKRGGLVEDDIAIDGVDVALAGYVIDRPMRTGDALAPLLAALDAGVFERGGKVAVIGEGRGGAVALPTDALALPDDGEPVRSVRRLEPPPDVARVRYIDEAAGYQSGSVVLRSEDEGASGAVDLDLPVVCGRGLARRTAERLLAAEVETVRIALGPLEVLTLEPGDVVAVEERDGMWRVDRIDLAETVEAHLRPVVEVGRSADEPDWQPGEPPGLVGRPFMAVLDLPPLPGQEDDDRPLVAVAADPWRPMRVFAGGSAAALTPRADIAEPATVGVLVDALEPGPLHRWDEMNAVVVRLEGRAPESGDAGAVLAGANTIAVEAGGGWELVQFREATLVAPGVWRLSGLLRGQQGTDNEMRAGASVGARVVVLDSSLARADVASGERGAPLIWRAGPAGSPPGGDAFAEIAAAWLGVQARPWSVGHLKVSALDDGLAIRWVLRARLDGDRWDGETVATDPESYRVRIFAGADLIREWQVDDASAAYSQTMIDADFPGGLPSDAALRVSQWSPRFSWGVEAIMPLA